jgi:hypothetical protein
MKQIRNGCFETNSSSMHSLIIKKKDDYPTMEELEENAGILRQGRDRWANDNNSDEINLHIYNNNDIYYGRSPFQVINTFKSKLKYYIASLCNSKEDIERVKSELMTIFDDIKNIEFSGTFNKNWGNGDYDQYGYAQNYGYFGDSLKDKNISLKEFLTNNKYVIIVDGDEYQELMNLFDSGLINTKEIDEIYTWPDGGWEYTKYDINGNVMENHSSWENCNSNIEEVLKNI